MNELASFTFSGTSTHGFSYAVGGICQVQDVAEAIALSKEFENYRPHPEDDVFDIDRRLAVFATEIFSETICAVGISICLPSAPGPSGGVIGNPRQRMSSANGRTEDMANGLSMAAKSGGPGIVVQATTDVANRIISNLPNACRGVHALDLMVQTLRREDIGVALVVADGTGHGQRGFVLAADDARATVCFADGRGPCSLSLLRSDQNNTFSLRASYANVS